MTGIQVAQIVQAGVVSLLGITAGFAIRVQQLDAFRQRLFALRDELFDFAADGNIPFSDPAYVLLRAQVNAVIRHGHQLTLFRALVSALMVKSAGSPAARTWAASWQEALSHTQNQDVRNKLEEYYRRSMKIAAIHLLLMSPALWLLLTGTLVMTLPILVFTKTFVSVRELFRVSIAKVISGPLDEGLIEEAIST